MKLINDQELESGINGPSPKLKIKNIS